MCFPVSILGFEPLLYAVRASGAVVTGWQESREQGQPLSGRGSRRPRKSPGGRASWTQSYRTRSGNQTRMSQGAVRTGGKHMPLRDVQEAARSGHGGQVRPSKTCLICPFVKIGVFSMEPLKHIEKGRCTFYIVKC